MKRLIYFIFIMFMVVNISAAQNVKEADFISAMHNAMAAVKKGSQWAFINSKGETVVNFRDEIVVTNNKNGNYPVFEDGRCLILQKKMASIILDISIPQGRLLLNQIISRRLISTTISRLSNY